MNAVGADGSLFNRVWQSRPDALYLVLFTATYVLAGGFSQGLAIIPESTVVFWPPAGIFSATLLLTSRQSWPWWIAAGCVAELTCNAVWFHNGIGPALMYFGANALTAVAAATLINRFADTPYRFESPKEILALVVLGAGVAPIFSATVIAATEVWLGKTAFWTTWFLVWLGDGSGLLISMPLTLLVIQAWRAKEEVELPQLIQAAGLGASLIAVALLAYQAILPTVYLTTPVLLWIAARYQFRGAAIALAAMTLMAAFFSSGKAGIFAGDPVLLFQKMVQFEVFLAVSAILSLVVASLSFQRFSSTPDSHSSPAIADNAKPAKSAPQICGLTVMALGALVLFGWLFGIDVVKSAGTDLVSMKANTALCFMALGFALFRFSRTEADGHLNAVAAGATVFALAVSLATLAEYAFGVNSGIDQLLFRDEASIPHPGRMSPVTAGVFFAASMALLMPRLVADHFNNQSLLWGLVLTVALAALAGHALNVAALFQIGGYNSMAVHAATGFAVLAGGGLALSWPRGKSDGFLAAGAMRNGASRFFFAAALVLFAAWARYVLGGLTGLNLPYVTFYPVVIVVALLAGWRAGIFATVLSALIGNFYFVGPVTFDSPSLGQFTGLVLFALTGFAVSYLADQWVKLLDQVVAERDHLDSLVDERTAALRQSNRQLKLALSAAKMTAWHYAPDTGAVTLTDNAETPDLPTSGTIRVAEDGYAQIHPDDREMHRANVEGALAATGGYADQYRRVHDGKTSWMEEHAQAVVDPDTQATNLVGVTANITGRKFAENALLESERRLAAVFEALPLGVALIDREGVQLIGNDFYKRLVPSTIPSREEKQYNLWEARHPDGRRLQRKEYPDARALRGEGVWPGVEFLFHGESQGENKREPIWLRVAALPLCGEAGDIVGATVVVADIDLEKRASDGLRDSEARFTHASELARFGAYEYDVAADRFKWSLGFLSMFRRSEVSEVSLSSFLDMLHNDDHARIRESIAAIVRKVGPYEMEYRMRMPDGGETWIMDRGETSGPIDASTGLAKRAVGMVLDITERKKNEQHQALLINELNHRVKNTLATIQSMASQTLRSSPSLAAARTSFEARLMALSKVHDVLTVEKWESAALADIVDRAIIPYCGTDPGRFTAHGADVRISSRMALAFAMTLHELCTNAVKYGALSNDTGRVEIDWNIAKSKKSDPVLIIRWIEKGGPAVEKPATQGFGTKLIERNLASDLGGNVKLTFAKSGVSCVITTSLDHPVGQL